MMNEGVQRMDELFTQALAAGLLRGDPTLIMPPPPPPPEEVVEAPAAVPRASTRCAGLVIERDSASLAQSVAQIRGLAG